LFGLYVVTVEQPASSNIEKRKRIRPCEETLPNRAPCGWNFSILPEVLTICGILPRLIPTV